MTPSPNRLYQAVFSGDGLRAARAAYAAAVDAAQVEYAAAVDAARRREFGKPRKKEDRALPSEVIDIIRARCHDRFRLPQLRRDVDAAEKERDGVLGELAPRLTFAPQGDVRECRRSYTISYASQGLGAGGYAAGSLYPFSDRLAALGFDTRVEFAPDEVQPSGAFAFRQHGVYAVMAACPDWLFDAVARTTSIEDMIRSWKKRLLNCHVFNPFLPHKMVDSVH